MIYLHMFNYCPQCASRNITFDEGKVFRCPDCGFTYYHNIAAATGCLIIVPDSDGSDSSKNERLVFLVRGKDPAIGKLDLPGGFVDAGEGVIEGLLRELREEIGWIPQGQLQMFASFSNVYQYKNIDYNTCDMYFSVFAPDLKPEDLKLETSEIAGVLFLKPEEIDFTRFAFPSTVKAVKSYLASLTKS